jgi:hypothetical protein
MSQPRSLAALLSPIARTALAGSRSAVGSLVADWAAIVGESWAARALPERLIFAAGSREGGTLVLRVEPADAVLVQHDEPSLLARINGHYGYRAVARLKLIQHAPDWVEPKPARNRGTVDEAALAAALAAVDDPEWHGRLAAFGRALHTRPKP